MIAGFVNHFAGMPELELVFAPRVQRLGRHHQQQIVAAAYQIEPRGFGLQHFRRHAIHPHLLHRHFARNIERRHGERRRGHLHLDPRDHVQREIRRHRGINPVIASLRIAYHRCSDSFAKIAPENSSRCRNIGGSRRVVRCPAMICSMFSGS